MNVGVIVSVLVFFFLVGGVSYYLFVWKPKQRGIVEDVLTNQQELKELTNQAEDQLTNQQQEKKQDKKKQKKKKKKQKVSPSEDITLKKQLSSAKCELGVSYGVQNKNAIWVDKGCEGRFKYRGKKFRCKSRNNKKRVCNVNKKVKKENFKGVGLSTEMYPKRFPYKNAMIYSTFY